ncbi:MAG TPA: hypothetical protein VMS37_11335 [Verrucomicrobiae bacterium]|nr:hypothetical protein [Verrucomicrobiae bacterium]
MMDDTTQNQPPGALVTFLAGLQAGMMALIVMLGWLGVSAWWQRHTFWTAANQMATVFHGGDAIVSGFGRNTPSGLAVYVLSYCLLGGAFALAAPRRLTPAGMMLGGVLLAVGWYWLWFRMLGQRVMPLVWLLHAERPMAFGHVLYGVMLARFPVYLPVECQPTPPPPDGSGS